MGISTNRLPADHDVYVRWYVKLESDWRFSTVASDFKLMILEADGATPDNGRTFLNYRTIDATTANLEALVYGSGESWIDTTVDLTNDDTWHAYEVRSFRNLSNDSQGRFQVWFDGVLKIDRNPFDAGNTTANWVTLCYRNGPVTGDVHMVFDEIIIADQGPIGLAQPSGPPPPAAPTELLAVDTPGDTGGSINLSWTPSISSGVTEQRLYRSTNPGSAFSLAHTFVDNTTASYSDTGLATGTTYHYVLRAYDTRRESANSNQASATPVDDAPVPNPQSDAGQNDAGDEAPVSKGCGCSLGTGWGALSLGLMGAWLARRRLRGRSPRLRG